MRELSKNDDKSEGGDSDFFNFINKEYSDKFGNSPYMK